MKIKEIYIESKKSKNFQTYTMGELITIEEGDDLDQVRKDAQNRTRMAVIEQLARDGAV